MIFWLRMTSKSADITFMTMTRETATTLKPKFDSNGLVTAIVTDHGSGELLMVAHMNSEALALTQTRGEAVFWSRSRQEIWHKGETSGNVMRVIEMRIDCDQDAIWLKVDPAGPACHTGSRSCFYRKVTPSGHLE